MAIQKADNLKSDLSEIEAILSEASGGDGRDDATNRRIKALAVVLRVLEKADDKGRPKYRAALVKQVRAQTAERAPRQSAKLLLQVIKVCLPDSKLSDQSQYARFIAACLSRGWTSRTVFKHFCTERDKSRTSGRAKRDAFGLKVMAEDGKSLLRRPRWLVSQLPMLIHELKGIE